MLDEMLIAGELQEPSKKVSLRSRQMCSIQYPIFFHSTLHDSGGAWRIGLASHIMAKAHLSVLNFATFQHEHAGLSLQCCGILSQSAFRIQCTSHIDLHSLPNVSISCRTSKVHGLLVSDVAGKSILAV